MPRKYACRFRVRYDEIDSLGHLNNAVCVRYMQEATIQASADAGYPLRWYEAHAVGWVVRRLEIRYYLQVLYGDELQVTTWISQRGRAACAREYDLTRAGDGNRVARARAEWVYVDSGTGRPAEMPEEFESAFPPTNEAEDLGIRGYRSRKVESGYRYRSNRRVQSYELDPMERVHHAVYLNWIEQAYYDAIRSAGHPLEELRAGDWIVFQGGHDIEYLSPARENDEIEIVSWICELGKVRGAWTHEVYDARNKKLLARDYSLGVFVNSQGKLSAAPQHIIEDVLQGPRS